MANRDTNLKQIRLYECLLRLKYGPEFAPLRAYLQECRSSEHDRLEKEGKPEMFFRAQGRAQVFSELMDLIERSSELLEKMKQSNTQ